MAVNAITSPTALSPRKPLQALSTNAPITPKAVPNKHSQHASPSKAHVSLTPDIFQPAKEKYDIGSYSLNASRKRPFEEIGAVEERGSSQTCASFSSMINYDPSNTSQGQPSDEDAAADPDLPLDENPIKAVSRNAPNS
jgi:hypothetical protein